MSKPRHFSPNAILHLPRGFGALKMGQACWGPCAANRYCQKEVGLRCKCCRHSQTGRVSLSCSLFPTVKSWWAWNSLGVIRRSVVKKEGKAQNTWGQTSICLLISTGIKQYLQGQGLTLSLWYAFWNPQKMTMRYFWLSLETGPENLHKYHCPYGQISVLAR